MDNEPTRRLMLADVDEVVSRLACALTVISSSTLQAEVRRIAGVPQADAFVARLPSSHCWVLVSPGARAVLVRQPPPGIARVDLEAPFVPGGPLWPTLEAATGTVDAFPRAYDVLTPLFDATAPRSRAQMAELIAWAPSFEQQAMRMATRGVALADALRPEVLAGLDAPTAEADLRLREYAGLLRMVADLQLLAADVGARGWLLGMAQSFEWRQWTPSWYLVRERRTEFIPAAAWAVQASGPGVADAYLDALVRSSHVMLVFDALFGLIALALSAPDEAHAITSEIEARRPFIHTLAAAEGDLVARLVAAALLVIAEPDRARRQLADATGFPGALEPGRLLTHIVAAAREHDAADPLAGRPTPLAFAMLPVILEGQRIDAFPEAPMEALAPERLRDTVRRAWGVGARQRQLIH